MRLVGPYHGQPPVASALKTALTVRRQRFVAKVTGGSFSTGSGSVKPAPRARRASLAFSTVSSSLLMTSQAPKSKDFNRFQCLFKEFQLFSMMFTCFSIDVQWISVQIYWL